MSFPPEPKQWMSYIPAAEIETYRQGGFAGAQALGSKPALIVVDVTLGFTGSQGLTLEEAIAEFSTACGPASWEAIPRIAKLLQVFRERSLPVVFTASDSGPNRFAGKATKAKGSAKRDPRANDFPAEIAPREDEWVLEKTKASAFFHTPLAAFLTRENVDSVVICGVSTSGCVRASVVDAASHGYPTFVVDDCCFDRSWFAHCANLFDMDAKYATVLSLAEFAVSFDEQSDDTGAR